MAAALVVLMAWSAQLQAVETISLTASSSRVVPADIYSAINYSGIQSNGFTIGTAGGMDRIDLQVTNLPAGVTIPTNSIFPSSDPYSASLWMGIAVTNVAAGDYTLYLVATSTNPSIATAVKTFGLHVGNRAFWTDPNTASIAWSVATNWSPSLASGMDVAFDDSVGNIAGTNNVTATTTIGRLSYLRTTKNVFWRTVLSSGITLTVTNGFSANSLDSGTQSGVGHEYGLVITGSGGASLIVTNPAKNFSLNCNNGSTVDSTYKFDLSGLPVLKAYVNRFGILDLTTIAEGTVAAQNIRADFPASLTVVASYVDPGGYAGEHFNSAIEFYNHDDNSSYQNGQPYTNSLGTASTFWADSFILGSARVGSAFNKVYCRSGGSTATFRNSDGVSRMTMLGVGVDSGTNTIGSGCRAVLEFSGNTLDILVDKLWLGRCRPRNGVASGNHMSGTIKYSAGTIDANTAILGYQAYTNDDDCTGIVNCTNANFVVNNLLVLGYSYGDLTPLAGPFTSLGVAQLNVSGATGKARINTVTIGGPANATVNNTINLTAGANLTLTNTIGTPIAQLSQLTLNASSLTLHLNGLDPRIYSSNVTTLGTCTLNFAAITNIGAYPVKIPLIFYENNSATFTLGTLPAGSPSYSGFLTNDTSISCICLVLTSGIAQPGPVTWTAAASGDWDTVTTNWVNDSTPYAYNDGVSVRFDDSGLSGSVNLAAARAPSGTTVSNSAVPYTFTGAGKLSGTGGLIKQGSGTLFLDNSGVNDFSNGINLSGGTLQVGIGDTGGGLGTGNVTNNAALVFNRTDNLTVPNSISGTGSLTQNGSGTIALTGAETYTGNTTVNAGVLALTGSTAVSGSANLSIASGAVLDVSGRSDSTLTLASGQTLKGNGKIRGNLTANPGSTVAPGQSSPGVLTATNAVILQGTVVMEIDKTAGTNDLLNGATINYGGTLVISNLSAALTESNSIKLFNATSYSGAFSGIVPATPGIDLAWDTNSLAINGTLKVVSSLPPTLLTWTGSQNGNWDTTTNWVNAALTPVAYTDGSPVRFNDSGLVGNINLTATFAPGAIIIDNHTVPYAFTGNGRITGTASLTILNVGTLDIDNSGINDFSGGISLNSGTIQMGNNDTNGSLGVGSVTNNATLIFNRADSFTVSNTISGSGTVAQNGSGALALAATNTYRGATTVSAGSLGLVGSASISASSKITISAGAALDVSRRNDGTLTLVSGQTLQGGGTVLGSLVVSPGSTMLPGQSSSGILTVTNTVNLQGTTVVAIDKTAGTNSLLGGAASITYGGTLVVSNLTAAIAAGDSFHVFDANGYSGAFTSIVPLYPGFELAWDTFELTDSGTLGVDVAPPVTPSATLKIDFSIAGRPEAIDPNFIPWIMYDAPTTSSNFSGITITFTSVGPAGTGLTGGWWKQGVDTLGVLMADDGMTVANGNQGGQIRMVISGLSYGPHTIATYHNTWDDPTANTFSPINISVNGVMVITNLVPSNRVTNNYDAASAYLPVFVQPGQDVVVLYQSNTNSAATEKNVWINGLEIDTVNSTTKALNPYPANDDEHANGDTNKSVVMTWTAAGSAVTNEIYFGTDSNAVNFATHASPEYRGSQVVTNVSFLVTNLNSLASYYWRVDEINATNGVAKGDLWYFRTRHLAFPGAEGYGRFARGGRGGIVIEVTNLNDSGPGSFRDAVSQTLADNGPRTIVFAVSGLIELQSPLTVGIDNSKLTIAGQTAPGKGINMKKYAFGFSGGQDIIVRDIRVYPGKYSGTTVNGMGFGGVDNSIADHCSSGWSMDECIPTRGSKNMTIQHVMIAEPLNEAGHKNYAPGTRHGYASSTSGDIGSWHHDLLVHSSGRNWSLAGGLTGDGSYAGYEDIRCNAIYNWDDRTTDGGLARLNFVNNYYKPGPATSLHTYLNPDHGTNADGSYGQLYYSSGNVMPGYPQSNSGGWMTNVPFFPSYVTTQNATNAYKIVISDVGCTQPVLDDHDTRVIREAHDGTYTYTGSASGLPGLPDSETDVGSWESYPEIHRDPNWDTDHDGLPDWWEVMHGLDTNSAPGDFSDANADLVGDEYTELERYLNFMAAPHFDCAVNTNVDIDLSQFAYGFSLTSPTYAVSNPTNGTVVLLGDGKTARFTATNNAAGLGALGAFKFSVIDSQGDTMTNVIGIHVLASQVANTPPTLSPVSDKQVNVGVTVAVTNLASDADVPAQTLTFSLTSSGPTNTTFGTSSGIFAWRPLVTQANTTNLFTVVVTDSGTPNLSATQSFHVTVNPLTQPNVISSLWAGGQFSLAVAGQTGPDYGVQTSTNLVDWNLLVITNSPAMPFSWTDTDTNVYPMRFYRIKTGPPLP